MFDGFCLETLVYTFFERAMVESAKILMESSTSLFCERQLGVNSHFKEKQATHSQTFLFQTT
jgi:hypothetical protein